MLQLTLFLFYGINTFKIIYTDIRAGKAYRRVYFSLANTALKNQVSLPNRSIWSLLYKPLMTLKLLLLCMYE